MRLLPPSLFAVLSLVLVACGGLSASEYRARLDAACGKLSAANALIPQQVRDQHLDMAAASRIAERNGEAFAKTIGDLDPPDDLRDAHERMRERGEEPGPSGDDRAALRTWVREWAALYNELGAKRCEQDQQAVERQIAAAS